MSEVKNTVKAKEVNTPEAKNGSVALSLEEKQLIEEKRKINEEILNCEKELKEVLIKHHCTLNVDPRSPINSIRIMIVHDKERK